MTAIHFVQPMHGPAAAIGVIVGTYWLRVLKMALKQRRSGGSANFIPPEPLGRWLRLVWHPVVWAWVAVPWVVAMDRHVPLPLRAVYRWPAMQWMAVGGAALALLGSWRCWRQMGRGWRMGIDPAEHTPLITQGVFARVRHPIYALSALLMICSVLAVPVAVLGVAAAVHLLLLGWEARREDAHLARVHGERFAAYRAAVGAFVPRVHAVRLSSAPSAS